MKYGFKRLLCLVCLVLLLTGCGAAPAGDLKDEEEGADPWESQVDWDKHHYYRVLNGREEEQYIITQAEQVEALDGLLGNLEERDDPSEEGEIAWIYVYCQEKTLLAGQDPEEERECEEIIRFLVYQDQDLVTLKILGGLEGAEALGVSLEDLLTFTVSVPAQTMETLRDPAQFAQ